MLINLINDSDTILKQSALEEIRRLKPLENFISQFGAQYDFHKEIAQAALRGSMKKHL